MALGGRGLSEGPHNRMWPSLDKKSSSTKQPDLEAAIDEALALRSSPSNGGAALKVSPGIAPRGGIMGTLQTREGQLGALSMALLVFQVLHVSHPSPALKK